MNSDIRQRFETKKAFPNLFRYYWPVIGVPIGAYYVSKWGDWDQIKFPAFVCWN